MNLSNNEYKLLYLVEGESEAALIKAIKNEDIYSGRVLVFNPWTKKAGNLTRNIRSKTVEYRAGKANIKLLQENLRLLEKYSEEVIVICQNETLEDELVKSCSIRKIEEFFNLKSINEHKKRFIKTNNLSVKLKEKGFDIQKIWIGENIDFLPENKSNLIKK